MPVAPDTAAEDGIAFLGGAEGLGLLHMGEVHEGHGDAKQKQRAGDQNIRDAHGFSNCRLGGVGTEVGEDVSAGDDGCKRSARELRA